MNEHMQIADLLPFYASGQLSEAERRAVEAHLETCAECREELALWKATANEVIEMNRQTRAQLAAVENALTQIRRNPHPTIFSALRRAVHLILAQIPLVRQEIFPTSALIMLIGCAVALIANKTAVIYILAPLLAAAGVAVAYGSESDPALELTLATPTSPRQVLLARLTLVFTYNLGLALAASLFLALVMPEEMFSSLILGWLGPMTVLSMLAVILSMWLGAGNASLITYLFWLGRWVAGNMMGPQGTTAVKPFWQAVLSAYIEFWQAPLAWGILSLGLLAVALWFSGKNERRLPRWV